MFNEGFFKRFAISVFFSIVGVVVASAIHDISSSKNTWHTLKDE